MESKHTRLRDLIVMARREEADIEQITVQPQQLHFDAEGLLLDGRRFVLDQNTRLQLLQRVGAPGWYWKKFGARFQMAALTEHLNRRDFGKRPKLVMKGGKLLTIARGELIDLPTSSILNAIEDALGKESESLLVARIDRSDERFEVESVSSSKAIAVRAGDIVQAGISMIHVPFGNEATIIQPFHYRQVCLNGMVQRECDSQAEISRTRRLPIDYPNGREIQIAQVRKLARQSWNSLQPRLEALRATSTRQANVEELLGNWLLRARISRREMMPRLLEAWALEGSEDSQYAAVNALTRVATHDPGLSHRQRRMLAALGGLLAFSSVHLCPRCYSLLATGHSRSDGPQSDPGDDERLTDGTSSTSAELEPEAP